MDRVLRSLKLFLAILLALVATSAPAYASGSGHIVAPGDPGSAQYQEDVPTASGSEPVTSLPRAPTRHTPHTLATPVVRELDSHGAAGRQAAALAEATAPPVVSTPSASQHHAAQHKHQVSLQAHPAATTALLTSALLGSGGGVGALLPIVLALTVLVMLALTLRRRSR